MSCRAIFSLELARTARRERTYWLRTLYVAFLSTVVALAWLAKSTGEASWSHQEHVGHGLFVIFAWVQFVLLNLAAPLSLCGAISEERSRATLPLLLSSPLTNLEIVVGKLFGGLIPVVLLLLAGLPIMFLLMVFGGLSHWEVLIAFGLTILSAVLAGAAALFFSSLTRTVYAAFAWTAAFVGGYIFVPALLPEESGPVLVRPDLGRNIFGAFRTLLASDVLPAPVQLAAPAGVAVAFVLAFQLLTALPLRWRASAVPGGALASAGRRWQLLRLFGSRKGRPPHLPGTGNWVARRDLGPAGRWVWASLRFTFIAGALTAGGAWLCLAQLHMPGADAPADGHRWFLPLLLGILAGMPLLAGVRAVSREWEQNTFPLLLASSLTGREIVTGKLAAVAVRLAPLGLVLLAFAAIFNALGDLPAWSVGVAGAEWLVASIFLLAAGGLAGMLVRQATRSLAAACGLVLGVELALAGVWIAGQTIGLTGPAMHAFLPWWILFGWDALLFGPASQLRGLLSDLTLNLAAHLLCAALALWAAGRWFGRLTGRVE